MKSRAAVLTGDRRFELRQVDVPAALPPGGVLLKVEGCGMCGSDIEQYEGTIARAGTMSYPCIPGHEIIGRIARIDDDTARLRGLAEGDRVAVHGVAPCGVCSGCMSGGRCAQAFYYGFRSLEHGSGLWGGYSEWLEITPRTRLYPVSPDLPIEDALLFNPLAAGYDWVVRLGKLEVGQSVLVLGAGQRGLASVIAAREAGAGRIVVTGLAQDAFKLDIARQLGATDTLVASATGIAAEALALAGDRPFDLVVDTTPTAFQPILDAISAVRQGGTIVLGGIKGYRPMPQFPIDTFLHKQVTMVGALSSTHWSVGQAIRLVESGRFPLHLLHSHRFDLNEVERAVQILAGEVPGEAALHISIIPGLADQTAGEDAANAR